MVKYKLPHPDLCFVGDEVNGNISMKGDGHAAGRLLLGAPGSVAYDRLSVTEKRITMIGLTALDGSSVHVQAGVIDSDYHGNIKVLSSNEPNKPFEVTKGSRNVQYLILSITLCHFKQVDTLATKTHDKAKAPDISLYVQIDATNQENTSYGY